MKISSKLFKMNLHQIQGVGNGAVATLDDWMHETRDFLGAEMLLDQFRANDIEESGYEPRGRYT